MINGDAPPRMLSLGRSFRLAQRRKRHMVSASAPNVSSEPETGCFRHMDMRRIAFTLASVMLVCSCSPANEVFRSPKVRILVSTGCPHAIGGAQDVRNSANVPHQHLLPSANPTAALICYYGSLPPGVLDGRQRLDGVQATTMAKTINRVDLKVDTGVAHCPAADGRTNLFAFSYQTGDDVDLWWGASGCQELDNGYVAAGETANPSFYDDFMGPMQRLHDLGPKAMGR
jgi:hypothetical protein